MSTSMNETHKAHGKEEITTINRVPTAKRGVSLGPDGGAVTRREKSVCTRSPPQARVRTLRAHHRSSPSIGLS